MHWIILLIIIAIVYVIFYKANKIEHENIIKFQERFPFRYSSDKELWDISFNTQSNITKLIRERANFWMSQRNEPYFKGEHESRYGDELPGRTIVQHLIACGLEFRLVDYENKDIENSKKIFKQRSIKSYLLLKDQKKNDDEMILMRCFGNQHTLSYRDMQIKAEQIEKELQSCIDYDHIIRKIKDDYFISDPNLIPLENSILFGKFMEQFDEFFMSDVSTWNAEIYNGTLWKTILQQSCNDTSSSFSDGGPEYISFYKSILNGRNKNFVKFFRVVHLSGYRLLICRSGQRKMFDNELNITMYAEGDNEIYSNESLRKMGYDV